MALDKEARAMKDPLALESVFDKTSERDALLEDDTAPRKLRWYQSGVFHALSSSILSRQVISFALVGAWIGSMMWKNESMSVEIKDAALMSIAYWFGKGG